MAMRSTASAIAFVMLWSPLAAQIAAPPTAVELPETIRDAIEDKFEKAEKLEKVKVFKDWRVANVDAQRAPCWRDSGAPPAVVQGDINGDDRPDYAVLVQGSGRTQLVAVLDRVAVPMVIDIDSAPSADAYLVMGKRGQPYGDPENQIKEFFTNDTVLLQRCGQPRDAYFWNGFSFRKVSLTGE
jgi:hypothetical protein